MLQFFTFPTSQVIHNHDIDYKEMDMFLPSYWSLSTGLP